MARKKKGDGKYGMVKFVSKESQVRYHDLEQKSVIFENGFCFSKSHFVCKHYENDSFYEYNIRDRHWEKFGGQPASPCLPLVFEFYANLPEAKNDCCFVRGKQVRFDAAAINACYDIPPITRDQYASLASYEMDDTIYPFLTHGREVIPTTTYDGTTAILDTTFSREAKAWNEFICTRFMPRTTQTHQLKPETCLLLFCILVRKSIDVGDFLNKQLKKIAKDQATDSIWFPSLITMLCDMFHVPRASHEKVVPPPPILDSLYVFRTIECPFYDEESTSQVFRKYVECKKFVDKIAKTPLVHQGKSQRAGSSSLTTWDALELQELLHHIEISDKRRIEGEKRDYFYLMEIMKIKFGIYSPDFPRLLRSPFGSNGEYQPSSSMPNLDDIQTLQQRIEISDKHRFENEKRLYSCYGQVIQNLRVNLADVPKLLQLPSHPNGEYLQAGLPSSLKPTREAVQKLKQRIHTSNEHRINNERRLSSCHLKVVMNLGTDYKCSCNKYTPPHPESFYFE